MANGYDSHSLKMTGMNEAASGDMPVGLTTAVKDKRFTRNGIGYRTQREASTLEPDLVNQDPPAIMYGLDPSYPGGTAMRVRGMVNESQRPWETAQEATRPQIKPRAMLERSGMLEALPPWLQDRIDDEEGAKEAAANFVRENMCAFPYENEARIALAVLSQFVDGDTLDSIQSAIEDQFGDPSERPEEMPEEPGMHVMPDGTLMPDDEMYESRLEEAPLTTQQRNRLPDSAFAIPEDRAYPINDIVRARNALSRVSQFGSDEEKRRVRNAVYRKYPQLRPERGES